MAPRSGYGAQQSHMCNTAWSPMVATQTPAMECKAWLRSPLQPWQLCRSQQGCPLGGGALCPPGSSSPDSACPPGTRALQPRSAGSSGAGGLLQVRRSVWLRLVPVTCAGSHYCTIVWHISSDAGGQGMTWRSSTTKRNMLKRTRIPIQPLGGQCKAHRNQKLQHSSQGSKHDRLIFSAGLLHLREAVAQRGWQVPLAGICGRVHGGQEAEAWVARHGGRIPALSQHNAAGAALQQAGDALQGLQPGNGCCYSQIQCRTRAE